MKRKKVNFQTSQGHIQKFIIGGVFVTKGKLLLGNLYIQLRLILRLFYLGVLVNLLEV